jgi:vancomycin permeability regulator SanA
VSQEQVARLLQKVIQEYWSDAARTTASTNATAVAAETNVEAAFRQASALMPDRLDLRFGIASALLSQAIGTNGAELELKLKGALQVYQEIHALDTNGFDAPILYAAYTRALGQTNASEAALNALMALHPVQTKEYLEKFQCIDRILQIEPNQKLNRTMPRDSRHAIVVLGAGLETNGTIKAKLTARLKQCLKLARTYPSSPIILTGGNQKAGVTEAYIMSQWCAKKGISRKRLILEDKARDTVENALFSAKILQKLGVTHVTVVTSYTHVRRGLADLQEACQLRGLNLEYDNLVAKTKDDSDLDKTQECLSIYRDVMRISGLWAYPGMRR